MGKLHDSLYDVHQNDEIAQAQDIFRQLIQNEQRVEQEDQEKGQYVGEVYSISYESALVLIHDHYRKKVGGIPSLSFLIATRIDPKSSIDYKKEDSSIILLRVMDAAPLPNAFEAERVRVETAQKASGEDMHWDSQELMDSHTHNLLSFAGIKCRVIGTFFVDKSSDEHSNSFVLRFGSDLSNYYPNEGLKVYKPNDKALSRIVNYRDPDRNDLKTDKSVVIGSIRYASTNRSFQGISNVEVKILPADLLGQKTALFGMTRTGKSNTTKIILQSVFNLRFEDDPLRVGQIVFDPNGEYANENVQDANQNKNPSAIKNIWKSHPDGKEKDVVTYGILPHPNDPNRKLMLINFYDENMLQTGKDIINVLLTTDSSKYIQNFCQIKFEKPDKSQYSKDGEYYSALTRYNRRVLAYRALLAKAGFLPPKNLNPTTKGLFKSNILEVMANIALEKKNKDTEKAIKLASETLSKESPSWGSLASAFEGLFYFLSTDDYTQFDTEYIKTSSTGESWADADLVRILEMFTFTKGANQIGKVRNQHTNNTSVDYAAEIYNHLKEGRLVIVDQSSGDPEVNQSSAERIMWHIFKENQSLFRQGKEDIPDIIVYLEEAHNLLPSGSDLDLKDVWVRSAKEGAKYRVGMVYTTQEVSSIQKNILKNTSNWLIGHLNNTDETKELKKYYDFEDFEQSIRRAQDKGFLRVKTLSNLFVIPVQVKKFEV
ncbi:DUF87 domain-containing protein [Spirulina sp. CCNP1310]|uniref:helicase HerA domain-containing protein n=1 Tax=Spirulina sp. CCNP1310 TaxID=3110249 RepID=UPI002B20129F|nr:DUF87 domain-containing protein [Spirulina sp. CCNP1310]MEA5420229.1 DUF87 domain-containing protein [Spirulina sp. CCNP1310]